MNQKKKKPNFLHHEYKRKGNGSEKRATRESGDPKEEG